MVAIRQMTGIKFYWFPTPQTMPCLPTTQRLHHVHRSLWHHCTLCIWPCMTLSEFFYKHIMALVTSWMHPVTSCGFAIFMQLLQRTVGNGYLSWSFQWLPRWSPRATHLTTCMYCTSFCCSAFCLCLLVCSGSMLECGVRNLSIHRVRKKMEPIMF